MKQINKLYVYLYINAEVLLMSGFYKHVSMQCKDSLNYQNKKRFIELFSKCKL